MTEEVSLKRKTFTNLLWRFFERTGAQAITFVVSIILARILSPDHYGLIALVTVIINLLNVFVDSGLASALIQKQDADETDFSTVFYINLITCSFFYLLLFLAAPAIARFYQNAELTPVIRVLGLMLVIAGLKNVQHAYVSKHLMFRKFFFSTLGGTIAAAIAGILLALNGWGVWALVAQYLLNAIIDTCVLWLTVPWRPERIFSFARLKALFSYGWKLLASNLLHTFYIELRQLIIGRVYSPADLAYYNRGQRFPQFISSNVLASINSVLFPVMAGIQNDIPRVRAMTRRAMTLSSYVMWPMLLGIAGTSPNLVTLLLSHKWLPCVPYLMLACFCFGLEPIQTANLNAIKAIGRSDLILRLEIIKKAISITILLCTMPFGVLAIAIGAALYAVIATACNSFPNKKLLNYAYFDQLKDILPSFLVALCMAVLIYMLPLSAFAIGWRLLIQVVTGALFYIFVTGLLRFESFCFLWQTGREWMQKQRQPKS